MQDGMHKMENGHMMSDKEMNKMMTSKKKKMSGKSYSKHDVEMARKLMGK